MRRRARYFFTVYLSAALMVTSLPAYAESDDYYLSWQDYTDKINAICQETDLDKREALMHEAEAELMDTWAVIPLYYYNDIYMMSSDVSGLITTPLGFKQFAFMDAPGNELTAYIASEPIQLDPSLTENVDGACLALLNFSGLYAYDKDGNLVPDLADGQPQVSADGLTYTIKMKDGLKWSDGDTLDAYDVVYSWNRLADDNTGAGYAYLCDSMNLSRIMDRSLNIEAIDDGRSLNIHLSRPCPYFLSLCAFPAFFPVPEQAVEAADPSGDNPGAWALEAGFVGSGPMTLTSWNHNGSMTYEKNLNYWNSEAVTLNKISFILNEDSGADDAYSAYKVGMVQFDDYLPGDEISNVENNEDFYTIPNLGTYYICFNVNSSLFAGKTAKQAADMRHAFSLLINRQNIVDMLKMQEPAGTFIPDYMADGHGGIFNTNDEDYAYPVTWYCGGEEKAGYYDPSSTGPSADNIAQAVQLLKRAGYEFDENNMLSASTPIRFKYLTNYGSSHVAAAESIQQDLGTIGIEFNIQQEEWEPFLDDRKNGRFDCARGGFLADIDDPICMLEMWLPASEYNDAQLGK